MDLWKIESLVDVNISDDLYRMLISNTVKWVFLWDDILPIQVSELPTSCVNTGAS